MGSRGQGKALVERLVGEVVNQGRLELIDELFTPEMQRVWPAAPIAKMGPVARGHRCARRCRSTPAPEAA